MPNLLLAGRIELHTLWSRLQGELAGHTEHFIDSAFAKSFKPPEVKALSFSSLIPRLMKGGYPEMPPRSAKDRRRAWVGSYLNTILQRDVRDISNIRDLAELPRLLALIASRAASLLDFADLARSLSMPQTTLKRYLALLEMTFLIQMLPAWFTNIGKLIAKAPKLLINDTGLLLHLLVPTRIAFAMTRLWAGSYGELRRGGIVQTARLVEAQAQPSSLPRARGHEVDIVLEHPDGRIVGIEVKAAATIDASHFRGLKTLAESAKDRFVRGIVLYTRNVAVPFAKNLVALPMPILWH